MGGDGASVGQTENSNKLVLNGVGVSKKKKVKNRSCQGGAIHLMVEWDGATTVTDEKSP